MPRLQVNLANPVCAGGFAEYGRDLLGTRGNPLQERVTANAAVENLCLPGSVKIHGAVSSPVRARDARARRQLAFTPPLPALLQGSEGTGLAFRRPWTRAQPAVVRASPVGEGFSLARCAPSGSCTTELLSAHTIQVAMFGRLSKLRCPIF